MNYPMQNLASLQTRGMPVGAPISRISSAHADTLTSSGTQATRLPSRRVPPHTTVPRQHLATSRFVTTAGVALPEYLIGNSSSCSLALRRNEGLKNVVEHVGPQLMSCLHKSAENEHDLAAMVNDFIENGSHDLDLHENSDRNSNAATDLKPSETLQALILNTTLFEKELLSVITMITLSIHEDDLACLTPSTNCKGGCIRRLLVKHLQLMKYDVAVYSSKWPSSGRVPRGEYEYIDVVGDNGSEKGGRLIVDVDFQSQFEIARPTQAYSAALRCLPVLFIGSIEKLSQVLQILAEAAKLSLKHNGMPVPPWRSLSYLTSKWMSPFGRLNIKTDESPYSTCEARQHTRSTKQCIQQLRDLKVCVSRQS